MNSLDVTYYSCPVASSWETLTFLGLVFDRVHFPGVFLPEEGYNSAELEKEIARLRSLNDNTLKTNTLINLLVFCNHYKYLKDFCEFTGKEDKPFGCTLEGSKQLAEILEEMIYGPRPEGFVPIIEHGSTKGIGKNAAIHYPGWLIYPANALIYSAKNDIPLLNDNPFMPVPSLGGLSAKDNSKILSGILTMECVKFALPVIPSLLPEQICEIREELKDYIKPFRLSMLKLSKELNNMIRADSIIDDIRKSACFLIETEVSPQVEELRYEFAKPKLPWLKKAFEVSKTAPELIASFFTLPTHLAIAKVLGAIGSILIEFDSANKERKEIARQNGFYYILKLKERNKASGIS